MFLPGFRDLVRPQWVGILEELKMRGSLPVPELARCLEMSYMGIKQHCESLHQLGYLERIRVPRAEVGRPEISYRLAPKADALFPQAGVSLSLVLLEQMKQLVGSNAPEKLLFQYYQDLQAQWQNRIQRAKSLVEKATLLAGLREKLLLRCEIGVPHGRVSSSDVGDIRIFSRCHTDGVAHDGATAGNKNRTPCYPWRTKRAIAGGVFD
jgi:predicted ArsR family transcriptional regulator